MAAAPRNPQPQPIQRPGLIASATALALRTIGLLVVSLLFSILTEFAGLLLFWEDQGWRHSHAMLINELSWLSEHFKASLILQMPVQTTTQLLEQLNQWLLIDTGFADFTRQSQVSSQDVGFWSGVSPLYLSVEDFVLAAVYTTFTFVVRLTILLLTTPLFLLAMLTGLVDGLMRRDLRKFGAGRESSFVYHRAKRAVGPLLILPWLIYLALPFSLHPLLVLLPSAVMLGIAVAITAATFKKYL